MLPDDVSFLEWAFKGLVAILLTIGGWLWIMLVGAVTAVANSDIIIEGTIEVANAGTITVQFAQNASNGSASTVLRGSSFSWMRKA